MSDIYNLVAKHLAGETTKDEELEVQLFRTENHEEYQALKKLWNAKGIEVHDFDATNIWNQVSSKPKTQAKVLKLFRIRQAAAVAIFLIFAITAVKMLMPNSISANETIVAIGDQEKVMLDDGSIVYLNKNAQLTYPALFDSKTREVHLEGEAFFEVQKDKNRPFVVRTSSTNVEVLGTSFNVEVQENETQVSVSTGKVRVENLKSKESVILLPTESAIVDTSGLLEKQKVEINYLAWKTGTFRFEENSLIEVINELSSFYQAEIVMLASDNTCQFTGTISQMSIDEVLEALKLSCGIEFKQKNNSYEIY